MLTATEREHLRPFAVASQAAAEIRALARQCDDEWELYPQSHDAIAAVLKTEPGEVERASQVTALRRQ